MPFAAALHGDPTDGTNYSQLFARFAGIIASSRLREPLIEGSLHGITATFERSRLEGILSISDPEYRSILALLKMEHAPSALDAFAYECAQNRETRSAHVDPDSRDWLRKLEDAAHSRKGSLS